MASSVRSTPNLAKKSATYACVRARAPASEGPTARTLCTASAVPSAGTCGSAGEVPLSPRCRSVGPPRRHTCSPVPSTAATPWPRKDAWSGQNFLCRVLMSAAHILPYTVATLTDSGVENGAEKTRRKRKVQLRGDLWLLPLLALGLSLALFGCVAGGSCCLSLRATILDQYAGMHAVQQHGGDKRRTAGLDCGSL